MQRSTLAKLLFFAALLALPLVSDSSYLRHVSIVALFFSVLVSSWNLSLGYGGVFNFGHMTFFALGAYACGILTKTFDFSPWLAIPAGIVAAVLASLLICLPVLRLKGIYVILTTFAFGQLCLQIVLNQSNLTGGNFGLVQIPPPTIGGFSFRDNENLGYYYAALLLLVLSTGYIAWVVRSDFGRSIVALRDNEPYAISRGVALWKVRLLTFAASAVFPGATGALYAQYTRSASPDLFGFSFITLALSMLLLGGIGTLWGPIVGAVALTVLSELLVDIGPARYLVIATLIVLVLRFFPGGLMGALRQFSRGRPPAASTTTTEA
jgi:branched-chain amino acid transport system permease protein